MAGRGDEVEPPGDDYEMSEAFRQWILERMRDEVMGQVSGTGLDRMTIVKDADSLPPGSSGASTEERGHALHPKRAERA